MPSPWRATWKRVKLEVLPPPVGGRNTRLRSPSKANEDGAHEWASARRSVESGFVRISPYCNRKRCGHGSCLSSLRGS